MRIKGLWKLPNGRDGCGGTWILPWWARPCLVNLWANFLLMSGAVSPPCSLTWGQTTAGVMVVMATYKRTSASMHASRDCWSQCPWPCGRPLSTHASTADSWTLRGKSGSVSCGVTAPFSWALVQKGFFLYPQTISVSSVLCKFCNQILLTFKVKFHAGSQSFCWIPRLGNLLWAPELFQECKNFFVIIVLQFVVCSAAL